MRKVSNTSQVCDLQVLNVDVPWRGSGLWPPKVNPPSAPVEVVCPFGGPRGSLVTSHCPEEKMGVLEKVH
ncbi:hypothetical protein RRG08_029770 [Elysia crispata]|uniref:Uncharacterized protein n=1 Tax=Elysia crispata TaxID=231223 RepID=A0AAE1B5I6_9GAST|nr:hypothetical protein RRG08_029770 [Elysia crispata]